MTAQESVKIGHCGKNPLIHKYQSIAIANWFNSFDPENPLTSRHDVRWISVLLKGIDPTFNAALFTRHPGAYEWMIDLRELNFAKAEKKDALKIFGTKEMTYSSFSLERSRLAALRLPNPFMDAQD